jgi:hypothetical protein
MRRWDLLSSFGTIGDCFDNAAMEAFWARMQVELLNTRKWATTIELAAAMADYIDNFYNAERRHSYLGNISPTTASNGGDRSGGLSNRDTPAGSRHQVYIRQKPGLLVWTSRVPDHPLIAPVLQPPKTPSICTSTVWLPGPCSILKNCAGTPCSTSERPSSVLSTNMRAMPGAHALGSAVNLT